MDLHYLIGVDDDHVAKFHGYQPRELGDPMAKEKTPRVKHKAFRNYRSGWPNNNSNNTWTVEEATSSFLTELCHRHYLETVVKSAFCSNAFLLFVQRFNSVLLRESFSADSHPEDDL